MYLWCYFWTTVVNVGREHFFSKSQQAFSADQAFAVNCLWDSQQINLELVQSALMLTSRPVSWGKHTSGLLQTNLISHRLPSVFIHKQIRLCAVGEQSAVWRRETESLSDITGYRWSLIICIGSQRQHICSGFVARMWWAVAACPLITLISALFIRLLPNRSYAKILCSWDFYGRENVFLFLAPLLHNVLCVPTATASHYISFSMLLY